MKKTTVATRFGTSWVDWLVIAFGVMTALMLSTCCAVAQEEKMAMNYTPLVVVNDHGIVTKASGIIIADNLVLTCFHVLEVNTKVAAPNGKAVQEPGQVNATVGRPIYVDPYNDIAILDFEEEMFNSRKLKFAKHIFVGEPVFAVTNALGRDGLFLIAHVAQVTEHHVWFAPAFPKGASGAAIYMKDEKDNPVFIGMVQGSYGMEHDTNIGYAVRARILKPVILEHIRPPRPKLNVVPFPDTFERPEEDGK